MSPERSEVEFFNFSAASRRTLQIVPTMSSEVQTLVNRNIFMTTGIVKLFDNKSGGKQNVYRT
ncbi:MAG: hypothetical protein V3T59_06675 [Desulfobacterales bacterium]